MIHLHECLDFSKINNTVSFYKDIGDASCYVFYYWNNSVTLGLILMLTGVFFSLFLSSRMQSLHKRQNIQDLLLLPFFVLLSALLTTISVIYLRYFIQVHTGIYSIFMFVLIGLVGYLSMFRDRDFKAQFTSLRPIEKVLMLVILIPGFFISRASIYEASVFYNQELAFLATPFIVGIFVAFDLLYWKVVNQFAWKKQNPIGMPLFTIIEAIVMVGIAGIIF